MQNDYRQAKSTLDDLARQKSSREDCYEAIRKKQVSPRNLPRAPKLKANGCLHSGFCERAHPARELETPEPTFTV